MPALATGREQVDLAVRAGFRRVAPRGAGWSVSLGTRGGSELRIDHEEGWLLFDAPARPAPLPAWGWLERHAELPGGVKLALTPDAGPRLRAELPLPSLESGVAGLESRLRALRAGLAAAGLPLGGVAVAADATDATGAGCAGAPTPDGLPSAAELCGAAGWPAHERDDGRAVVTLEVPDGFAQAEGEHTAQGLSLFAPLLPEALVPPAHRAAVAMALLRAAPALRLARPLLRRRGGAAELGFDVSLGAPAGAEEVGESLAALSVAASRIGEAARRLAADEELADLYLGRSAAPWPGWDAGANGKRATNATAREKRDE